MKTKKNKFSLYHNGIKNTIPNKEINIKEFLELLKKDNPLLEKIRQEKNKDKRNELKSKLSYVTFAGTFKKREKISVIKSSGYACFDIDDINNLEEIKQKTIKNKYTHLLFISPSGNGLKCIVKIPDVKNDEEYKKYWISIEKYYNFPEGDTATKDISRACYLSMDKEPYFNPNSEVYTKQVEDITTITPSIKTNEKDPTRSAKEYREVIKLIGKGNSKEKVFAEMEAFSKWSSAPEQYKELTYNKALGYVEAQKEINVIKEIGEPNIENLEILQDINLFENINKEFDKKIVGEIETRKVIFLCANGRLVENAQIASYNLLVNDDAGMGKDYVSGAVLDILPKDIYIHKTRISPTVFTYWHNPKYEPEWNWNGKVFYPEDVSEMVLNSDVFKVMCSAGSSATIVIKQRAIDIDIVGKPVMITTTATATPNPELTRRFVILNLDGSIDQTKLIMRRHSEFKESGIVPKYNEKYIEAMKFLKRVKVKVPFASKIDEHFPNQNIIMRTHYPRFLDFISASAAFHQYQREVDDYGFILAEGQDYDIARGCFLKLCSNQYMIPLTILQKKILKIYEKEPELNVSVTQFHSKHNFMSLKALQVNLGILTRYGLLVSGTAPDKYGRDMEVYSISKSYIKNENITIPEYKKICRIDTTSKVSNTCKVSKVSKVSTKKQQKDVLLTLHVIPQLAKNNSSSMCKKTSKHSFTTKDGKYISMKPKNMPDEIADMLFEDYDKDEAMMQGKAKISDKPEDFSE